MSFYMYRFVRISPGCYKLTCLQKTYDYFYNCSGKQICLFPICCQSATNHIILTRIHSKHQEFHADLHVSVSCICRQLVTLCLFQITSLVSLEHKFSTISTSLVSLQKNKIKLKLKNS